MQTSGCCHIKRYILKCIRGTAANKTCFPIKETSLLIFVWFSNLIHRKNANLKRELTIGPSSRPFAPRSWEPGLFIALTGIPIRLIKQNCSLCEQVQYYVLYRSHQSKQKRNGMPTEKSKCMLATLLPNKKVIIISYFGHGWIGKSWFWNVLKHNNKLESDEHLYT